MEKAATDATVGLLADDKAELIALVREMADALDFARSVAVDDYNGRAVAKKADALTSKAVRCCDRWGAHARVRGAMTGDMREYERLRAMLPKQVAP